MSGASRGAASAERATRHAAAWITSGSGARERSVERCGERRKRAMTGMEQRRDGRKRGKRAERRVAQEASKARDKRHTEAKRGRRRESHAGSNGREDVSIADAGEEDRT